MSNQDINYEEFIQYVHAEFDSEIELDTLKEVLFLEEDYNKDSPLSIGKSLTINRLVFTGKKLTGEVINYDKTFYTGVNVWIADNMKGKSTIFKIIKYALTGVDSIKPDVKGWIKDIILEFQIGELCYTIHIDKKGRDKGALFAFDMVKFFDLRDKQKLDVIEREKEFDFKSRAMLEEKIQEFFFDNFSYYILKYTLKNSSKDSFELSTANLSWATYFKSIYLEASNYNYLFFENEKYGSQGRKIFEMILGLPLTYPINMLGISLDKTSESIGKLKLADNSRYDEYRSHKKQNETRYAEVIKDIERLKNNNDIKFDEKPLVAEYNKIQEHLNGNRTQNRVLNNSYTKKKDRLRGLDDEINNLEEDKKKIKKEIARLSKQVLNVKLYKEAGSFFSNLDVKSCPHCENEVTEERKKNEISNHECSLCGENSEEPKIEKEELELKLLNIENQISEHQIKVSQVQQTIEKHQEQVEELTVSINALYGEIALIPSMISDQQELDQLELQINTITTTRTSKLKEVRVLQELEKEEAVLKFKIEELGNEKLSTNSARVEELSLHKEVLAFAIRALEKKRIQLNKDILSKLEGLILKEVHAFGLRSINRIIVSHKYDLVFTQNDVEIKFEELTEGEKLRVKLAFYLSLIQLDIEFKLGRHPRFLIFDSPGGEEMIEKHLQGLSEIFKDVNKRFTGQLQIFVGSALQDFSNITDKEKTVVKDNDEFLF